MNLCSLVLFLVLLPSGAHRRIRILDSEHGTQQQNNMLANSLEVSAEALEALLPGSFRKSLFHRAGQRAGASRESFKQAGRRPGLLEPHSPVPWFRFGPCRAKVALRAGGGSEAGQSPAWGVHDLQSALCAVVMLGSTVVVPPSALAVTDTAAVGKCLLRKCQLPLARCVGDPVCAANLLCLQTCTGKPDEAQCQIKCGDEFSNSVTDAFTTCAVSEKKCVPQRQDDGSWPVPMESALVESFSPGKFTGEWYISAGLNPAFDCFDCQLHKFSSPASNKLVGDLQWRITNPVVETEFDTRFTTQKFVQDPKVPGILRNRGNEYLHYQDDWYILAAREDAYFVVYYRGSNDAWDGYGGAVVYSRSPKFPKEYSQEIGASLEKIGRSLKDFTYTNNKCAGKPTLKEDLVFVESRAGAGLASAETSFIKELTKDIKIIENEVVNVEKELEKDVVKVERELEKDVAKIGEEIVRDETNILNFFRRQRIPSIS